jgi:hypothetical protein
VAIVNTFDRVQAYVVTIPAGTSSSSPYTQDVSFDPGELVGIELTFPDGLVGLVGLAIATANQQIIPWSSGTWIIANNVTLEWSIANQSNTGSWQAHAYNTDVFDHNIHLRFFVQENQLTAQAAPVVTAPPLDLSGIA